MKSFSRSSRGRIGVYSPKRQTSPGAFQPMSPTAVDATLFQTPEETLQEFQRIEKYARWNKKAGRRETWGETVDRTVDFLRDLSDNKLPEGMYREIGLAIYKKEVMPSMRLLAMAGPAAKRDNATIYNCSYLPVIDLDSFVEALSLSMAGCGVGFSVEKKYVSQLPMVVPQRDYRPTTIRVRDSAEGWGDALFCALDHWFHGFDVVFDWSEVRPAGAILKTKGGRASGPEPFAKSLASIRDIVLGAAGRSITPLEAHDIMCHIGSAAVSGGVRRTAMISLFDEDDDEMRQSKSGEFWIENPQRQNANNSVVYLNSIITIDKAHQILEEMDANGTGEPGIFNRAVARSRVPNRRAYNYDFGTNPCGEIILRPFQLCNLTAVVARADDTPSSLERKARLATIIGTIQSMATYFPNLRDEWRKNCEEERLLGVDITGWMDSPAVRDAAVLESIRDTCIDTNKTTAMVLGINPSASITCNKPSGNTSVLVDCSSGIHPRWSKYYVRRARIDAHSAVAKVLMDYGVPMVPEIGQGIVVDEEGNETVDIDSVRTWVVEFPVAAPTASVSRNQMTAIDQLENWKLAKLHWTEHNPSCTITYEPEDVEKIGNWLYFHWNIVGGLTFYPKYDGVLVLPPYEEITQEEYEQRKAEFPWIDWSVLSMYETDDNTKAAQELACMAGACELTA